MGNTCVKYHHCRSKDNRFIVRKFCKVQSPNLTLTFDPKIYRDPPWVMITSCVKYHHCMSKGNRVIVRKQCKLQSTNSTLTFDLFTPKSMGGRSSSGHGQYMCEVSSFTGRSKDNRVIVWKPNFHRQMDGQPAMVEPVYTPLNFVGGGGGGGYKNDLDPMTCWAIEIICILIWVSVPSVSSPDRLHKMWETDRPV